MAAAHTTFASLVVGSTWTSVGRTITETDLSLACMTSGDWHPVHADQTYAQATPLGRRVLQGTYGVHIAAGMATAGFPLPGSAVIAALGFSEWKLSGPLVVGDTVHVEVEIASKRVTSDGKRGVIERRIRLKNQDARVIQEGVMATLVKTEGGNT